MAVFFYCQDTELVTAQGFLLVLGATFDLLHRMSTHDDVVPGCLTLVKGSQE